MGDVVQFRDFWGLGSRKTKTWATADVGQVTHTKVARLKTRSLPINPEKIRASTNGSAAFLSSLLREKKLNIWLDQEELSSQSTLRVIWDNDESWEMSLEEFIEIMNEKPEWHSHRELLKYLQDILNRVWVEILLDAYSPEITKVAMLRMNDQNLRFFLSNALVGELDWYPLHLSIRTNENIESICIYPEEFENPKEQPLFVMVVEYLIRTLHDSVIPYHSDTPVQILRYHAGIMYIIETTYWTLYTEAMVKVYSHTPAYRAMQNGRIALELFHRKYILPRLRK